MLVNRACCCGTSCTHYFDDPGEWCEIPGSTLYYTRTGGIPASGGPFALTFGENSTWKGWYGLIPVATTAASVWDCASAYAAGAYNTLLRLQCRTVDGIPSIRFERQVLMNTTPPNTQVSVGQVVFPAAGEPYLERTCGTGPNTLHTVDCTNIQLVDCAALDVRCVLPTLPYNGLPYSLIDGRITL